MKILDLITFVKARVNGVYFANQFPIADGTPDDCITVKLTGGFPTDQWTGKKQPSFQIRVRGAATTDGATESKAYEIHNALTNLANVMIGDDSIVIIRSLNSTPIFLGYDEQKRPIYTMNFECVARP